MLANKREQQAITGYTESYRSYTITTSKSNFTYFSAHTVRAEAVIVTLPFELLTRLYL